MLERTFQASLIKDIKKLFPGSIVIKTDPTYIQGLPDLLILFKNKWAALECKKGNKASKRPNQEYYVNLMNSMSFARFIDPTTKKEVLNELQQAFRVGRETRLPKCKSVPLDKL